MSRRDRKKKGKVQKITKKDVETADNTMLKIGGALVAALVLLLVIGQFL